jgi:hypothetical protein
MTVGALGIFTNHQIIKYNPPKIVVLSATYCFCDTWLYKLITRKRIIYEDIGYRIDNKNSDWYARASDDFPYEGKATSINYYHDNFDKWKELYMCMISISCEFRDVFFNMVDYYVLHI